MERGRLFVDTGAWLAIIDPADRYHQAASDFHRRAVQQHFQFFTTNLVIAESYTLISFAVMRDRELREAFAFDHHFDVLGFVRRPAGPL